MIVAASKSAGLLAISKLKVSLASQHGPAGLSASVRSLSENKGPFLRQSSMRRPFRLNFSLGSVAASLSGLKSESGVAQSFAFRAVAGTGGWNCDDSDVWGFTSRSV